MNEVWLSCMLPQLKIPFFRVSLCSVQINSDCLCYWGLRSVTVRCGLCKSCTAVLQCCRAVIVLRERERESGSHVELVRPGLRPGLELELELGVSPGDRQPAGGQKAGSCWLTRPLLCLSSPSVWALGQTAPDFSSEREHSACNVREIRAES